jgi:hypothetical protein
MVLPLSIEGGATATAVLVAEAGFAKAVELKAPSPVSAGLAAVASSFFSAGFPNSPKPSPVAEGAAVEEAVAPDDEAGASVLGAVLPKRPPRDAAGVVVPVAGDEAVGGLLPNRPPPRKLVVAGAVADAAVVPEAPSAGLAGSEGLVPNRLVAPVVAGAPADEEAGGAPKRLVSAGFGVVELPSGCLLPKRPPPPKSELVDGCVVVLVVPEAGVVLAGVLPKSPVNGAAGVVVLPAVVELAVGFPKRPPPPNRLGAPD